MAPEGDEPNLQRSPPAHILPRTLLRVLQRHFYAGVKEAEVRFNFHMADEDAVTGALGERLTEPQVLFHTDGQVYSWSTSAYKIRGRGPSAPENELGADGIFQLDVLNEESEFLLRKGLLFQSKIEWHGTDGRLLHQAQTLLMQSRSAIVISYSSRGYQAIAARDVVAADGNRRRVRRMANKSLAEVLGDEFVWCKRGDMGLYWEPERERLMVDSELASDFRPGRFIGTTIQRLRQ